MRKRKETQKESLSSARATRGNMPQENNVAEQERMMNAMNKINNVLDGEVESLLKQFKDDLPQSNSDLLLRNARDLFNGESMIEVEAVCMTILFDIALERGRYDVAKTMLNMRLMFEKAMNNAAESVTLLAHE